MNTSDKKMSKNIDSRKSYQFLKIVQIKTIRGHHELRFGSNLEYNFVVTMKPNPMTVILLFMNTTSKRSLTCIQL